MTVIGGVMLCPPRGVVGSKDYDDPPPYEKTGLGQPTKVYSHEVYMPLFLYAPFAVSKGPIYNSVTETIL